MGPTGFFPLDGTQVSWNAVSCFFHLTFPPKKDVLRETVLVTRSQLPDILDTLKYRILYVLFKISQFQCSN